VVEVCEGMNGLRSRRLFNMDFPVTASHVGGCRLSAQVKEAPVQHRHS
jgi:hypothetical protein